MNTLANVRAGGSALVIGIRCAGNTKRRIMDMGVTKGVEVSVIRSAPLGDPIEISVRGCGISLRKADAKLIEVE